VKKEEEAKMKNLILSVFIVTSLNAMARTGGGSSIGPANPAAVNCIQMGGELETVVTPEGANANCVIEQWILLHAMLERGLVKDHKYGPGGMPSPAAVNCLDIAGALRMIETPEGKAGYCVVDQWALFRVIDVVTQP
jgi:putative hemolysin